MRRRRYTALVVQHVAAGDMFQDIRGLLRAVCQGVPVRLWLDQSGNGNHAVWREP